MKQRTRETSSREPEEVYHAAARCQAAALSETSCRLHGQQRACSLEGQKTGALASQRSAILRGCWSVKLLSCHEGGRRIGRVRAQHGEENARPDVGQRSDGQRMTFPFRSLALIVGSGPTLLLGARPRQLMQRIAQRLDTPQPPMGLGIIPTLKQDGRGASQGLQAGG